MGGVDLFGGEDVQNIADGVNAFVTTDGATTSLQTVDITGPAVLGEATAVLAGQAHRRVDTKTNGAWASLIWAARSRGEDAKVLAYSHRFAGAYLTRPLGNIALTAGPIAGVESHDSTRDVLDNLEGVETATATFDSQFISASVAAEMAAFTLGALELRPSAMTAYTVSSIDGYTEEGTTNANLQFDSRTAQTLTTRAQLETVTALANVDLAYRFGVDGRFGNEDDIAITFDGQSQDFAAGDSDAVLVGFLGAQARFAPADGLHLVGDVEYGFADGEEQTFGASLNVSFAF